MRRYENMRAIKLTAEPFEFVNFHKLECTKEINQHGSIHISGLIHQEKVQEYMNLAEKETWVSVKAVSEEGEEKTFFSGVLTKLWITMKDKAPVLTIEVRTGSYLLDIQSHMRSFQEPGFRYHDIIETCINAAGGHYIMLEKKEEVTDRFLMQYHETDWEFVKRLASYMGVALIPEDEVPGKNIYFGYRSENVLKETDLESYRMEQNYGEYKKKAEPEANGLSFMDTLSYVVTTREILGLGQRVNFMGRKFVVGKVESRLSGQELQNKYHLITPKRGLLTASYNGYLSGISLKAEVTAVDKTVVQISIKEDENSIMCKNRWFDYATVYSTPDGTGWYCMPEIGDTVRLVFPDEREDNAYVASSIHVGAARKRVNPDEKSWMNRQEKEILFTPTSIILRNNKGISMEISDQEGIKLQSNKDITLQSGGSIGIASQNSSVHMSADDNILMKQGAAKIVMDEIINIEGGKVYMN